MCSDNVMEITIKLESLEVKIFWTDGEQSEGWLNFTFSRYCSVSILLDYSDCLLKLRWLVCSVCEIVLWFFLWVLQVKKLIQTLPRLLAELSPGCFGYIMVTIFFFFTQQELLCNCNFCWMQCILCGVAKHSQPSVKDLDLQYELSLHNCFWVVR